MKPKHTRKVPHRDAEAKPDVVQIKIHFLRNGSHLKAWADAHGYAYTTVSYAVRGIRRGPKSRQIIAKLRAELGGAS